MNVFCFGPNKTGTVSLTKALHRLGWRKFVKLPWKFQVLNRNDVVYSDIFYPKGTLGIDPFLMSHQYREEIMEYITDKFPNDIYIFNFREITAWLESRQAHVRNNQHNPEYMKRQVRWIKEDVHGWMEEYEEYMWLWNYVSQLVEVLSFDVPGGDGYERLCGWIGLSAPDEEFPKLNKSNKQYLKGS